MPVTESRAGSSEHHSLDRQEAADVVLPLPQLTPHIRYSYVGELPIEGQLELIMHLAQGRAEAIVVNGPAHPQKLTNVGLGDSWIA